MTRNVQEPTVTESEKHGDKTLFLEHPAFAQVGVTRSRGGGVALYGSDTMHDTQITLRVHASKMERKLARDWHFADHRPIVEVVMSEAQWATLLSSMNVGMGVPCTMTMREGKPLPRLPDPRPTEHWRRDFHVYSEEAQTDLADALAAIDGLGLSKTKAATIREKIERAQRTLNGTLPWLSEKFTEHMEETVQSAKMDVHAHITQTIAQTGLDALKRLPKPEGE